MASSCDVLIVAEQAGGEFKRIAGELATKGKQLAGQSGGRLSAAVVGPGARQAAEKLGEYGVQTAFVAADERFDRFPIAAECGVVARAVEATQPTLILMGTSDRAKDLSGRLSARLSLGVAVGAGDVQFAGAEPAVYRTIFGGALEAVKGFPGGRGIVLMRPNAVPAEKADTPVAVDIREVEPDFGGPAQVEVVETVTEERKSLPVEEASVVVAGGRGLGGPEGFGLVQELASAFGGSVGSTRAAVDAGWIEYPSQVGQTGKAVKPKLYIALGISGAVQHRVGMQTSDVIVAVNKNPDAAIFLVSDLGVVGDVFEIVPKLAAAVRQRKQA